MTTLRALESRSADSMERRRSTAAYAAAFERFLKTGDGHGLTPGFAPTETHPTVAVTGQRAMGVSNATAGGFLVPSELEQRLIASLASRSALLSLATILETADGSDISIPRTDDTGTDGGLVPENTAEAAAVDVAFGQARLPVYLFTSGTLRLSWQLIQDGFTDWATGLLTERVARAFDTWALPYVMSNITVGKTGPTGESGSISKASLQMLEHSIRAAYRLDGGGRTMARWLMADSSLQSLQGMTDEAAVWAPDPTGQTGGSILSYPFTVDDTVPAMGANARSIAFGNFAKGLIVRRVTGISLQVLSELYAPTAQSGFRLWARLGIAVADPAAIRLYQHSAS